MEETIEAEFQDMEVRIVIKEMLENVVMKGKTQCIVRCKKMVVKNIKWDTDGDEAIFKSLPQRVDISNVFNPDDYEYEEDMFDDVSDWLSDKYGFCHGGFEVE